MPQQMRIDLLLYSRSLGCSLKELYQRVVLQTYHLSLLVVHIDLEDWPQRIVPLGWVWVHVQPLFEVWLTLYEPSLPGSRLTFECDNLADLILTDACDRHPQELGSSRSRLPKDHEDRSVPGVIATSDHAQYLIMRQQVLLGQSYTQLSENQEKEQQSERLYLHGHLPAQQR